MSDDLTSQDSVNSPTVEDLAVYLRNHPDGDEWLDLAADALFARADQLRRPVSRWFVYVDVTYYPYGEFVEAETPEAAAELVSMESDEDYAVVVAPADAVKVWTGKGADWRIGGMEYGYGFPKPAAS